MFVYWVRAATKQQNSLQFQPSGLTLLCFPGEVREPLSWALKLMRDTDSLPAPVTPGPAPPPVPGSMSQSGWGYYILKPLIFLWHEQSAVRSDWLVGLSAGLPPVSSKRLMSLERTMGRNCTVRGQRGKTSPGLSIICLCDLDGTPFSKILYKWILRSINHILFTHGSGDHPFVSNCR